jgi:RNA polymerase sigma-70 factor (ECF subfamily)
VTSDPDGMLLDQYVRTQDPVAFDQIARRYRAMVFATARRVTRSHHDAEDVAQGCFLELAKKAASVRISIAAFLHSTATRRSIDLLRDQTRRRKHELKAAANRVEPEFASTPERDWEEISPEVDEAIDRLPHDLKTIVILYFLRGLSATDISVETGLKKGTIQRRLQVGVRRLRSDLAKGNRFVSAGVLAVGLKVSGSVVVPASLTAATGRMALAAGSTRQPSALARTRRPWRFRLPTWLVPIGGGLLIASVIAVASTHWLAKKPSSTPYDDINRMYSSYLPVAESSRLPLHTTQIKSDRYSFWRGAQPLFYEWCKTNCKDWLAESDTCTLCSASPNLEDIYRTTQCSNTDDSARLPIQIELLHGMITVMIASNQSSDGSSSGLAEVICKTFKATLASDDSRIQLADMSVEALEGDRYIDERGDLRSLILNRQGALVAFLRPSPLEAIQVERLLADSLLRNASLLSICGTPRPRVRDIRACVRRDSIVTEGQLVLIVQLQGSGVLLEMKRQTPSPAELAELVVRDPRSPGQRAAEDAAALSPSGVAAVGWCDQGMQSFTVAPLSLYPQVCELSSDRWHDPIEEGRAWAIAASTIAHRKFTHRSALIEKITPQFQAELAARCDAWLQVMHTDLEQFNADPRVARDRAKENELSLAWTEQSSPANK